MRIQEILLLLELRRNPAQNQKIAGHQEAIQFLKSKGASSTHDNNYGVSMTAIPKLGVNPTTQYNTPVGIYFYPASYYIAQKSTGGFLDFQDDAQYIQIFKFNPDKVLEIDTVNESEYNRYIGLLHSNINSIATLTGASENMIAQKIDEFEDNARGSAKIKSYGGYLWYVLWQLSLFHDNTDSRPQAQAKRSSTVWNTLFRLIGVDIIIDNSSGIIHGNEPCQGVVINPRSIQHVNTIENIKPLSPDEAEKTKISNTSKVINKPNASISYMFLVTAIFKNNKPKENIKLYAKNTAEAETIANKHWANAEDLIGINVAYAPGNMKAKNIK